MYSLHNNTPKSHIIHKMIDILLTFTPTESSPNGNYGYVQRNVREHIATLSPIGLDIDIIAGGDVHTPTVWQVVATKKKFTHSELKTLKAYIRKYIANSPNRFGDWYTMLERACRVHPSIMSSIGFTVVGGRITLPNGDILSLTQAHSQRLNDRWGAYQDTKRNFIVACDTL